MADVQAENGFTKIAHEILESMAKTKMSPTQYRLIFVIWRYTYGFQRIEHDMSLAFLVEATGCDKRQIQRDLKRLEERNIIRQKIKNGSYRKLSFNKNYDSWDSTIGETTNGNSANGKTTNPTIGKNTHGTIGETTNQDRYIDNFKDISSSSNDAYAEIIQFYQSNLQKTVTESPFNYELIGQWFDEWGYELLLAAMKVAAKQEAKGVAFVEGVLKNWRNAGVNSIENARTYEKEFKGQKKKPYKSNVVSIRNRESQYDDYDYGF